MSIPSNDEYLAYLLSQRTQKRKGFFGHMWDAFLGTLVVALCLIAIAVGWEHLTGAPAAPAAPPSDGSGKSSYLTPAALPPQPRQQQPIAAPAPLPDCATVHDTTTACERTEAQEPPTETPTPELTPTAEGFWSAEDLAAFTATAEAFYNPDLIPTAPPAFVQAIKDGCADPTKVAQSPLLASWCGPDD